jgi:hypothetical protein
MVFSALTGFTVPIEAGEGFKIISEYDIRGVTTKGSQDLRGESKFCFPMGPAR